ncbi:ThiF family adenylyltransferase [Epibacterium sp. Ofav1-8]|uniref:ThiF family adenylyltransferase n=1 Tax=Epibacterium sp. Ofav1-8 TaxID=2917735 RepID=UPI001EF70986|nr:ThiF family adenylyltransferase [Epibacterium sp. Ofav1-8]MCG7625956.1 Mov34/MPN/PAD-1 family protein [Epibacterium sp. Ofav1-8]
MSEDHRAASEHPRNVLWELSRISRSGPVIEESINASESEDGRFVVAFEIKTDLLLEEQETRILDVEPVVFRYPRKELVGRAAPIVSSGRPDFPRSLQHLITSGADEPAVFCLARSGLQPIYEHAGIEGVIARLVDWFRDAKTKSYHADGWEPVPVVWPENPILGYLNPRILQEHAAANPSGGYAYIRAQINRNYLNGVFIHAELPIIDLENGEAVKKAKELFGTLEQDKTSHIPAVFCWANADEPDDFPYFNTWTSVKSIVQGTEKAKLAPHLTTAMNRLEINFGVDCDRDMAGHRAVILILGIWRPVPIDPTIVGLSEDANARQLELRTYYLQRDLADYCNRWDTKSEVQPFIGMVPPISETLAAVSGEEPLPSFTLIGAGALGSAFVDYATRGGATKFSVYDHDMLLAHNLARHRGTEELMRYGKADVAAVIANQRLQGTQVEHHSENFLEVKFEKVTEEINKTELVIDTSADAQVRRRLSIGWESGPKIQRSEIFHEGRLGVSYLTELGSDHNLTMMHMQLIAHAEHNPAVRDWLKYEATQSFLDNELILGFGCSSMTTKMPAYKVDAHASSSFAFCKKHTQEFSKPAILLNSIDENGLPCGATEWHPSSISTFGPSDETANWKVLVSQSVLETLHELRLNHAPDETGGYLYGGIDEYLSQIYVVAASSQPPDTIASPTYLQLGRWGQTPWEKSFVRRTKGRLAVVGTWHSHPNSAPIASNRDWKTVKGFVAEDLLRALPTLMAITGAHEDRMYVLDATVET